MQRHRRHVQDLGPKRLKFCGAARPRGGFGHVCGHRLDHFLGLIGQLGPLHLACGCARDCLDHPQHQRSAARQAQPFGNLRGGLAHGIRLQARSLFDRDQHLVPTQIIGHAAHGHGLRCTQGAAQLLFEQGRVDLEPAGINQLVCAAFVVKHPALNPALICRRQPAIRIDDRFDPGTRHQTFGNVRPAQADQAFVGNRDFAIPRGGPHAFQRSTVRCANIQQRGARGLGQPVMLHDPGLWKQIFQSLLFEAGHVLAADLDPAHLVRMALDCLRIGQQDPPERWHGGNRVDLTGGQHPPDLGRIKAIRWQIGLPARRRHGACPAKAEGKRDRHADIFADGLVDPHGRIDARDHVP